MGLNVVMIEIVLNIDETDNLIERVFIIWAILGIVGDVWVGKMNVIGFLIVWLGIHSGVWKSQLLFSIYVSNQC